MNDMSGASTQLAPAQSYVASRMAVMQRLHSSIRMNEFGLPTQAFRSDLIPGDLFDRPPEEQTQILTLATVTIVYEGGLPVIEGRLYWEQLPWEPKEDYAKFTDYRRLQETHGYRSINLLVQQPEKAINDEGDDSATLQRDQALLAILRQQYTYYAWGFRVKAYDMVGAVAYERLRERRAMETENHHYIELDAMFKQFTGHWKTITSKTGEESPWNELGITDTLKAMKSIMELQRVAAGLPASTPLTPKEAGGDPLRGHSMETRLRSHAKNQALLEEDTTDATLQADELLKDPRLLAMAQELILAGSKDATNLSDPTQGSGADIGDEAAQTLASQTATATIVRDTTPNGQASDD